jgi:prepilin-type N-terminal cleavage/methylation domain-containing protein
MKRSETSKTMVTNVAKHDMARRSRGVTLIELIMVIVLSGAVMIIGAGLVSQSAQSFSTADNVTEMGWQGRVALERMEQEIRAVASTASITTWTATALTFTNTVGTSIGYTLAGSTLQRTQAPTAAPQPQPLADNITSLGFTYWDRSGTQVIPGVGSVTNIYYITVTLGVAKGDVSSAFRTTVYPRNFL